MKQTVKFFAVILCLVILTSCGGNEILNVTPEEIFAQLESDEALNMPIMVDVAQSRYGEFFFEPDNCKSYVLKEAGITTTFAQIILVEAKEDKLGEVKEAVLKHQTNLKDATMYPQGREAVAASVVDVYGNLVYMICDVNSEQIHAELLEILKK